MLGNEGVGKIWTGTINIQLPGLILMIGKRVSLNLTHWFAWRGFEDVPPGYGKM